MEQRRRPLVSRFKLPIGENMGPDFLIQVVLCQYQERGLLVIPPQAGIQCLNLDSRLRGNDGTPKTRFDKAVVSKPELTPEEIECSQQILRQQECLSSF
jgi:hypothetical protein